MWWYGAFEESDLKASSFGTLKSADPRSCVGADPVGLLIVVPEPRK